MQDTPIPGGREKRAMQARMIGAVRIAVMVGFLVGAASARATTYCVSNSTELQAALTAAAASTSDDEIRLRQGIYTPQQTFVYNSPNSGWAFLTGGWITANNDNCGQQVWNAAATILDGAGQHQVLQMLFTPPGAINSGPRYGVWNLSIRSGVGNLAQFQRGGGLQMQSTADVQVEFWLDNVIVANNSGYFGGGADFYARRGLIRVANSVFTNNSAPNSAFGHFSAVVLTGDGPNGVLIVNSTFANGQCAGQGGRGCGIGATLGGPFSGAMRMDIINSLFFNNAVSDVNIEGAAVTGFGNGVAFANYSLVGTLTGNLPLTATNPLSGDPRFVDAPNQDLRLRDDSPMINRGLGTVPIYSYFGSDLTGAPRLRFSALDPGAYENQTWDFIFRNGFQ
jgi:hypothetical protein